MKVCVRYTLWRFYFSFHEIWFWFKNTDEHGFYVSKKQRHMFMWKWAYMQVYKVILNIKCWMIDATSDATDV